MVILLLLLLHAGVIHRDGFTDAVDGVGEEVAPDRFVEVVTLLVGEGAFAGDDGAVGDFGVVFDVEVSDETAGIPVGWFGLFNIYDGAELVHTKQLPGSAVVIGLPAGILNVGESEKAVFWRGGRKSLPVLILVAGAREGDDTSDFRVFGKAGGSG